MLLETLALIAFAAETPVPVSAVSVLECYRDMIGRPYVITDASGSAPRLVCLTIHNDYLHLKLEAKGAK